MTRTESIQKLKQYYLDHLVEDPYEGTSFDCKILDFLNVLEEKWKYYPHGPRQED